MGLYFLSSGGKVKKVDSQAFTNTSSAGNVSHRARYAVLPWIFLVIWEGRDAW